MSITLSSSLSRPDQPTPLVAKVVGTSGATSSSYSGSFSTCVQLRLNGMVPSSQTARILCDIATAARVHAASVAMGIPFDRFVVDDP